MNLNRLVERIKEINEEKGWNDTRRSEMDWAMLVVTELAEVVEAFRSGGLPNAVEFPSEGWRWSLDDRNYHNIIDASARGLKPEGMAIEYADALIRILHWFAYHEIDVEKIIEAKLEYNKTRPYRHGNKRT